jgi:mannan endo-1,4-beta-mannosidase
MFRRLLLFFAIALVTAGDANSTAFERSNFITVRGDVLYDGDRPFRFISFNVPNLQLIEDNFSPGAQTAWAWPNEFELNDAMASVRQLGGTVARTYALSVRRERSDMGDHVYVRGPGEFNEEAFRSLDLALEAANRHGVRLIIPLVDNWHWQGGVAEYAAFRRKPATAFWNDEQVISDFEKTIEYVLTRVNSRTGVAYRDDPAIFGWETGNELDAPPQWTARIAKCIKALDANHLVIDGYSLHGVREESLADPNIDVVTTHHYPNVDRGNYIAPIRAARALSRGRKPYFVGEFGFIPTDEIEQVFEEVIRSGVSGALLWSLRFHSRDGGFYWHSEPAGNGIYKAYHWPGFGSGEAYDERAVLQITRDKAFAIRDEPTPAMEAPGRPRLLPIRDPGAIAWQGSAGASAYIVERSISSQGPWDVIATVDDAAVQYRPLFCDRTAELGGVYFYRVAAKNASGVSPQSNVVGPVSVDRRTLSDEGRDLSQAASVHGDVEAVTGDDRRRREDVHRLRMGPGSEIVYQTSDAIDSFEAMFFLGEGDANDAEEPVVASFSSDGQEFSPLPLKGRLCDGAEAEKDYSYLPRLSLSTDELPPGTRLLKISARRGIELSYMTIRSGALRPKAAAGAPTDE